MVEFDCLYYVFSISLRKLRGKVNGHHVRNYSLIQDNGKDRRIHVNVYLVQEYDKKEYHEKLQRDRRIIAKFTPKDFYNYLTSNC